MLGQNGMKIGKDTQEILCYFMHGRFSIEARGLTRVVRQVAAGTFKQGSMKLFTSLRSRKIIYKYCLLLQIVYTNLIFNGTKYLNSKN